MTFQIITDSEIQAGSFIDTNLLTKIKNNDDALKLTDENYLYHLVPVGVVLPFAGTVAPTNYLMTDGSALSRITYAKLFSVIGTTYGVGDGSTTFNVPDTRAAFLRGAGASVGFTQNHTTTIGAKENDAMQGHGHNYDKGRRDDGRPSGTGGAHYYWDTVSTSNYTVDETNGTPRIANETRPNNLGINYIIKAF